MAIDMQHKASKSMREVVADKPAAKEKIRQVTVYLPESKWRKLKIAAFNRGTTMTGLVENLVDGLEA